MLVTYEVSEAVEHKVVRNRPFDILDDMDREHGLHNKAARAWARRVLKR